MRNFFLSAVILYKKMAGKKEENQDQLEGRMMVNVIIMKKIQCFLWKTVHYVQR